MTRIFKADKALFAYLRHHARIAERKLALGKNECQSRYAVMISAEHRGVFGDIGGKLKEITLRFVRLCAFEYAYLVICLHHADRLYKERCARGGGIMHETLYLVFVFCLDGNDESPVSHGDYLLLEIF